MRFDDYSRLASQLEKSMRAFRNAMVPHERLHEQLQRAHRVQIPEATHLRTQLAPLLPYPHHGTDASRASESPPPARLTRHQPRCRPSFLMRP